MEKETLLGLGVIVTALLALLLWFLRHQHLKSLQKHYALCKLNLRRLPASSPTRKRIEVAQKTFALGWKALSGPDPYQCLSHFAHAVEIDELGCQWRQQFEKKVEKIGDFFTLPPKDDRDKYQSMLAEAYLLVLLHTVVSLQGGQQHDLEEDYQVVKTRMDVCVNLQPDNPAVYKMRADLLQRFGHLANRIELINDFKTAIRLAEEDTEGAKLNCPGVDARDQRRYLIAYSAHQLGGLLHRDKQMDPALQAYTKAAEYADPAFVNLADTEFSLCILTLMRADAKDDTADVMLRAVRHYKRGLTAEKEALKYLPLVETQVSKALAKELTRKFAKMKAAKAKMS